jgi:hypothetical protein
MKDDGVLKRSESGCQQKGQSGAKPASANVHHKTQLQLHLPVPLTYYNTIMDIASKKATLGGEIRDDDDENVKVQTLVDQVIGLISVQSELLITNALKLSKSS